jgi:hypothetical protein
MGTLLKAPGRSMLRVPEDGPGMRLASLAVPGCDFRRSAFGLTLAALLGRFAP